MEELHRRGTFNVTRHRGRKVLPHPGGGAVPVVVPTVAVDPPDDLPSDARAVWLRLAPHAVRERTLTPATAAAFQDLCEAIVLKQMMLAEIRADGLAGTKVTLQMDEAGGGLQSVEKKAHTLLSHYRGMMQRVEAGLARFCLAPFGKAIYEAEPEAKPANPLAKFLTR